MIPVIPVIRVNTKKDRFFMKSPTPEVEGFFQIQPPIYGVNFSNNNPIHQLKVKIREAEHETTFESS